ncbi:MAG: hypothetical protein EOO46_22195 [Flavobacterium sp.]|nr:MAG: hypothetical protein EOO46_22195 [Flavobacterium sp.]
MYLKLAIAGRVIASVPLNAREAGNLEYLYTKRCQLRDACVEALQLQKEFPVFYIEVPSKMNRLANKQ